MRGARAARALALLAAVCAGGLPARAPAADGLVPDQSKLQLAGWIGLVAPGVGYSWFGRRLEADVFFGWVPPALGGEHILSVTSKATWLPLRVSLGKRVTLQPLSLSAQLTYTLGSEYWVREPSRYPSPDYYPLPSALRAGLGLGGDVGLPLLGLERVSLYYELVALDVMLGYLVDNPRTLGARDVVSLALGLRVEH